MAGRSPRAAWSRTRNDWKPELLYGAVGGLLSIGVMSAAGWPESHLLSYGIPILSILGAALLVPFVQFLWRLAWQPWESLKTDVAMIRSKVEEPPQPPVVPEKPAKKKAVNKRLTALNYVRTYDDMTGAGLFGLRRAEAIQSWTDNVVPFLVEHVSAETAERMLKTDQSARRDLLAEIAEELD
ncbi:MAG TPA: hypothetical protein VFX45_10920 [Solirubrobacterales bacterium]|nr:hypothetical protein [Solirubrobacterales bacterium]